MTGRNNVVQAFFILLRAGLWEKEPDNTSVFPLTGEEWGEIFGMARRQTVTALVYQGVCMLPEKFFPPQNILLKWVSAVDVIERLGRNMDRCLDELYGMFVRKGMEPVLQKGQGVASFYENHLSRECGDIDLYFPRKDEMHKAVGIVQDLGCRVTARPDGSYNFRFRGTEVEIHPFLIDISNPFKRKLINRMENSFGYVKIRLKGCENEITVPSPFINLLLLNTHILKHALGWGIGVRQLCDMARACYAMDGCYDKLEMEDCCKKLGIYGWTCLLDTFMVDYLGLDERYLLCRGRKKSAEVLEKIIIEGGNFGMEREGRKNSGKSKLTAKWNTVRSFGGNIGFALKYAPAEGFWTFAGLAKGQL